MQNQDAFMWRCLELAKKGKGKVEPNPMVGALLVHEGRIIGEGYHQNYGGPHAEVNAIDDAIQNGFENLLEKASLYVSLEPCSHFGKTPPCAELIIRKKIPHVVIACTDPNPLVNGKGIRLLKQAGVQAELIPEGPLKQAAQNLLSGFVATLRLKRPRVILKWAQTADGYIGSGNKERWKISHAFSDRLVHKWRSEVKAILIGRQTALLDDPLLNNRHWPGPSPLRCVLDPGLSLPHSLRLFDGTQPLVVFNFIKQDISDPIPKYILLKKEDPIPEQILHYLDSQKISSLLVEGGAILLNTFIRENIWDEARIIKSRMNKQEGVPAPTLPPSRLTGKINCLEDEIFFYENL